MTTEQATWQVAARLDTIDFLRCESNALLAETLQLNPVDDALLLVPALRKRDTQSSSVVGPGPSTEHSPPIAELGPPPTQSTAP